MNEKKLVQLKLLTSIIQVLGLHYRLQFLWKAVPFLNVVLAFNAVTDKTEIKRQITALP